MSGTLETLRNNRWVLFTNCSGLFLMSMLYRASAAVIAPDLARDLNLTAEDLGLLGAMFFYSFALIQLPMGLALDRAGAKLTMIVLNLVGMGGALVFAFSHGLTGGLISRAMLGLGMSANFIGSLKLFLKCFEPQKFATISGIMVSVGSLGSLLATSPLVLLAQAAGWRGAFIVLGLVNGLFTLTMALMVREARGNVPAALEKAPALASIKALFRNFSFWCIAVSGGLRYAVYAAFQTLWAGPFLIIHLGLSNLTAGNLLLTLSLGFIIGAPLGGFLSDRVFKSRKKAVYISLAALSLGMILLAHWPGPTHLWLMVALLFSLGLCAPFSQVAYAHIKELMPAEMAGTAMTGINLFISLGAGVFVHVLGGVLDQGGGANLAAYGQYYTAFMICAAVAATALIIYSFSRDSKVGESSLSSSGTAIP
ncbi:MAG: MFS transporter [Pseudomonadota bacterium]